MKKKRVLVIGGGITGLAAAFYLKRRAPKAELILVESSSRLGGKIETERAEGCLFETGPDSFLARKESAAELVRDVGLEKELVHNDRGQAFVCVGRQLYPIPKSFHMGIPTSLAALKHAPFLSYKGKARAALDYVLPCYRRDGDVSAGNFFKYRFGSELVDCLIEPLLSGIYAGDLDRLSMQATFDRFLQMEQQAGSLIRALSHHTGKQAFKRDDGKGQFLSLKTGLQSLVNRLEQQLSSQAKLIKNNPVRQVTKEGSHYQVLLGDGTSLAVEGMISAVPHPVNEKIFPRTPYFASLARQRATSVATVVLGFVGKLDEKKKGTGFVVSRRSDLTITACTWTGEKWPHTVPPGMTLLRCYVGRPDDEAIVDEEDETIVKKVLHDLQKVMGLQKDKKPLFSYVRRWHQAMPQYVVGHRQWLAHLRRHLASEWPGVHLVGASYDGLAIPDCISQGKRAAEELGRRLQ